MAEQTQSTGSSSWLDKILNTGLGVVNTITNKEAADSNAKAAQANAKAAQTNAQSMTKWYLIGGGVLLAIVVAFFAFGRKK